MTLHDDALRSYIDAENEKRKCYIAQKEYWKMMKKKWEEV